MQTTAIRTVANSLPEKGVILLTLLISDRYILFAELRNILMLSLAEQRNFKGINYFPGFKTPNGCKATVWRRIPADCVRISVASPPALPVKPSPFPPSGRSAICQPHRKSFDNALRLLQNKFKRACLFCPRFALPLLKMKDCYEKVYLR